MITMTVRRTWRERLFTLPWRPFTRTKQVPDEAMAEVVKHWQSIPIERVLDAGRPMGLTPLRRHAGGLFPRD